jgi:hypothetical protein
MATSSSARALSITATSRCGAPPPVTPDLSDREAILGRHEPPDSTSSWHDVVAADPQFADQVRRTFAVREHATLATLRRDESPRSSGTELDFAADGNLYLGRMPCSLKALDLRRDPRLALHCPTEDYPADHAAAWLGDGKMAGTAVGVSDPSRVDQPHRFRIDVTEVALTSVVADGDHLCIQSWHPGRGRQRRERR